MPSKRDREEDEALVRGGFGVETLTGGRSVTMETLMEEMSEMKTKIDGYVKTVAEQSKEIEEKNSRFIQQAVEIAQKNSRMEKQNSHIKELNNRLTQQEGVVAEKEKLMAEIIRKHQILGKYTISSPSFILQRLCIPIHFCESLSRCLCAGLCGV